MARSGGLLARQFAAARSRSGKKPDNVMDIVRPMTGTTTTTPAPFVYRDKKADARLKAATATPDPYGPKPTILPLGISRPATAIPRTFAQLDAEFGPHEPVVEPGSLEELIGKYAAALQNPTQMGGIPMPDRAAYIRPYDEAQARAETGAAQANNVISGQYDGLQSTLNKQAAGYAQAQAQLDAQHAAASSRLRDQAAALMTESGSVLQGAPASIAAGRNATADAQRANMMASQADATDLSRQIRNNTVQGLREDATATQGAEAAALQSNSAQLRGLLAQIGLGRAQADRQYQSDAQAVAARNAEIANSNANSRLGSMRALIELRQSQADAEAKQQEAEMAPYLKAAEEADKAAAKTSGREWVQNNWGTISRQYPGMSAAFAGIMSEKPTTAAEAQSLLNSQIDSLQEGDNPSGYKFTPKDIDRFRWMLNTYFGTRTGTSPEVTGNMYPTWRNGKAWGQK